MASIRPLRALFTAAPGPLVPPPPQLLARFVPSAHLASAVASVFQLSLLLRSADLGPTAQRLLPPPSVVAPEGRVA